MPPSVPTDGICSIILGGLFWFGHSLAHCPACLQIRHLPHALSFKDLGSAIGLPWRATSIWAYLVSFLFSLSGALASLSCFVMKGIGGCLDHLV